MEYNLKEWEYITCPECNSKEVKEKLIQPLFFDGRWYSFRIVACMQCGLHYLNPHNKLGIGKYYANLLDVREEVQNEFTGRLPVYKEVLKYIKKYTRDRKNIKILDIGCAAGVFLKLAKEQGYETFGIEASPRQAEWAKKEFGLSVQCAEEIQGYLKKSFDIITLLDVLEHIIKPSDTLNRIHEILKDDGFLFVKVPNAVHVFARWRFFNFFGSKIDHIGVGEHVLFFHKKTLVHMLENCGFDVLEVKNATQERVTNGSFFHKCRYRMNILLSQIGNIFHIYIGHGLLLIAKKKR